MKELLEIIKTSRSAPSPTALATIVQTSGSTYRRPGARMLILPDGRTVGCISGGCLDQDVVQQGLEVIKNQKPVLITYDTSSDQDLIFGAGVGCQGVINILVEFLPPRISNTGTAPHFLGFLENLIDRRRTGAAATVIAADSEVPLNVGDRVIVDDHGNTTVNLTDGGPSDLLTKFAHAALAKSQPELICHELSNGSARIFAEPFHPQRNLVILGAGHDAMPLSRLAEELGFRVSVVDGRSGYATRERFPLANQVIILRPEDEGQGDLFDARTAAVIMSHNYLIDQAWLKRLLPLRLPYLGLMGPRRRAEKMLLELRHEEFEINEHDLPSLHNPIGLDIGAETPEQIALAILAEVQAAFAGHEGGKLRHKKGTIHLTRFRTSLQEFLLGLAPEARPCARSG
jgi:xanthine dehydrogenase accessory factor